MGREGVRDPQAELSRQLGYGNAFYREPIGGYFKNSHLDVLAGVDRVDRMGVADPDRLAMMGWSAGGHLVNKLITFTNRFKAASSGAGVANWISLYGMSDTRSDRDLWLGGTLWQTQRADRDVLGAFAAEVRHERRARRRCFSSEKMTRACRPRRPSS